MLPDASEEDIRPAVNVLQIGITSSKATTRFACLRTLNIVCVLLTTKKGIVECQSSWNACILQCWFGVSYQRSQSCYFCSCHLHTLKDRQWEQVCFLSLYWWTRVDSLIKQITSTLSDIDDEFKQVLIKAVYILCTKFSNKHVVLLNFLASFIREVWFSIGLWME